MNAVYVKNSKNKSSRESLIKHAKKNVFEERKKNRRIIENSKADLAFLRKSYKWVTKQNIPKAKENEDIFSTLVINSDDTDGFSKKYLMKVARMANMYGTIKRKYDALVKNNKPGTVTAPVTKKPRLVVPQQQQPRRRMMMMMPPSPYGTVQNQGGIPYYGRNQMTAPLHYFQSTTQQVTKNFQPDPKRYGSGYHNRQIAIQNQRAQQQYQMQMRGLGFTNPSLYPQRMMQMQPQMGGVRPQFQTGSVQNSITKSGGGGGGRRKIINRKKTLDAMEISNSKGTKLITKITDNWNKLSRRHLTPVPSNKSKK